MAFIIWLPLGVRIQLSYRRRNQRRHATKGYSEEFSTLPWVNLSIQTHLLHQSCIGNTMENIYIEEPYLMR